MNVGEEVDVSVEGVVPRGGELVDDDVCVGYFYHLREFMKYRLELFI